MATIKSLNREEDTIADFIQSFYFVDEEELWKLFTHGKCYWFAYILKGRFPFGRIIYDTVNGHFMFYYLNKYYDIHGEVYIDDTAKDASRWVDWEGYAVTELSQYARIVEGCVL